MTAEDPKVVFPKEAKKVDNEQLKADGTSLKPKHPKDQLTLPFVKVEEEDQWQKEHI